MGHTLVDETRVDESYLKHVYGLLGEHGARLSRAQFRVAVSDLIARRTAITHRQLAVSLFGEYSERGLKDEFLAELFSRWTAQRYIKLWVLHRDVMPALRQISKSHNCGIIANQTVFAREFIQSRVTFRSFFKVVILSAEVGLVKPDPRIFLLALQRARTEARNSVYVGDRIDFDVAPAKALGMTTVRVRRKSMFSQVEPVRKEERADYEIEGLWSLTSILD